MFSFLLPYVVFTSLRYQFIFTQEITFIQRKCCLRINFTADEFSCGPESFVFIFLFVFVQRTALYVFLCWLICPSKQSHYSVVWWRNIFSRKTLHFSRKNIAFLEEGNDKYSGQLRFGTTCVVWDWHLCVGGTYTYIVKYDSWIAPNPFPKHWRANRSKTQIQALKKQKRFPGFCLIHDTLTLKVLFSLFISYEKSWLIKKTVLRILDFEKKRKRQKYYF